MADVSFRSRVRFSKDALASDLDEGVVLMNLKTGVHFGLDPVGSEILVALTGRDSIQSAFEFLRNSFDVDPDRLRADLSEFISDLQNQGLVEVLEQ